MKLKSVFSIKTYETKGAKSVVFFACPFGFKNWQLMPIARRLQRAGYTVISYDATKDVFYAGDPQVLRRIIEGIKTDIKAKIAHYQEQGMNDFGFFGSSLGSFIMYARLNDIKEMRWGIFNTGGNIAKGMWNFKKAREVHEAKGLSLQEVEDAWKDLQYPKFTQLQNHHYMFVSSTGDAIVPLSEVGQFLPQMEQAGARVTIKEIKARNHGVAVLTGLSMVTRLLTEVRK